ncbi:MAG TPA: hypothetical protein VL982_10570 [Burkholderiales bacterium]|nr:hypothetical protein [Burkholderiales bacterium]
MRPTTKLWQAWWLGGAMLALPTALLVWATDSAYDGEHVVLGALATVARILLYLAWFNAVWRCSRNVQRPLWTYVARSLLIAGLLASAMLY